MNDLYKWPVLTVEDYAGDYVKISEGTLDHIARHHPSDASSLTAERMQQILVSPSKVYVNHPEHPQPKRLNYYSEPFDTDNGLTYHQVLVDKVADPALVLSAWSTDMIGGHGECIYPPPIEDKS